ncbi:MAG: hypothetical protein R2695_10470 [Acidimicrobiales bacterium]
MGAAFDGLTDEWKTCIEGLHAIHDYTLAFAHRCPKISKRPCARSIRWFAIPSCAPIP